MKAAAVEKHAPELPDDTDDWPGDLPEVEIVGGEKMAAG